MTKWFAAIPSRISATAFLSLCSREKSVRGRGLTWKKQLVSKRSNTERYRSAHSVFLLVFLPCKVFSEDVGGYGHEFCLHGDVVVADCYAHVSVVAEFSSQGEVAEVVALADGTLEPREELTHVIRDRARRKLKNKSSAYYSKCIL